MSNCIGKVRVKTNFDRFNFGVNPDFSVNISFNLDITPKYGLNRGFKPKLCATFVVDLLRFQIK